MIRFRSGSRSISFEPSQFSSRVILQFNFEGVAAVGSAIVTCRVSQRDSASPVAPSVPHEKKREEVGTASKKLNRLHLELVLGQIYLLNAPITSNPGPRLAEEAGTLIVKLDISKESSAGGEVTVAR